VEREHLLPVAPEGMDLAQTTFPTVNSLGCAQGSHQRLPAPLKSRDAGAAKIYASIVELWYDGRCVRPMSVVTAGSSKC